MGVRKANGVSYVLTDEGNVRMTSPKTIRRYQELKNEHPKSEDYGVFFAFSDKQFEEGRQELISKGYLKEGEKVCSFGCGVYGTRNEIHRYLSFYDERIKQIAKECDPQEVYFYECNNHESGYTWCDDEPLRLVADYFGKEAARKIKRLYSGEPIDVLLSDDEPKAA
jgi:hypothetical protein